MSSFGFEQGHHLGNGFIIWETTVGATLVVAPCISVSFCMPGFICYVCFIYSIQGDHRCSPYVWFG